MPDSATQELKRVYCQFRMTLAVPETMSSLGMMLLSLDNVNGRFQLPREGHLAQLEGLIVCSKDTIVLCSPVHGKSTRLKQTPT